MGMRSFAGRIGPWIALLGVALGCEDRMRPVGPPPPGDGFGPTSSVLTPGERDTVHIGATFALDVQAVDPDGIDSVWTTLEPDFETLPRFAGNGQTTKSVGYTPLIPNDTTLRGETLFVRVQATDQTGDTGAVFTRRLLIQ